MPDIDDLIDEHLFGLKPYRYGNGGGEWRDKSGKNVHGFFNQPKYSTDIKAAWEVVEKMREKGLVFQLNLSDRGSLAYFYDHNRPAEQYNPGKARAFNTPRAICLSALKTLGVETEGVK